MPLILLGIIVIVGIVIYALVIYGRSEDEDMRPVRERYSHAFPPKKRAGSDGFDYDFGDDEPDADDDDSASDGNTMRFPSDAELEKRKRNIR